MNMIFKCKRIFEPANYLKNCFKFPKLQSYTFVNKFCGTRIFVKCFLQCFNFKMKFVKIRNKCDTSMQKCVHEAKFVFKSYKTTKISIYTTERIFSENNCCKFIFFSYLNRNKYSQELFLF